MHVLNITIFFPAVGHRVSVKSLQHEMNCVWRSGKVFFNHVLLGLTRIMKAGGKLLSYLLLPEQLCQQWHDINNQDTRNLHQALTNPGNLSAGVGSCICSLPQTFSHQPQVVCRKPGQRVGSPANSKVTPDYGFILLKGKGCCQKPRSPANKKVGAIRTVVCRAHGRLLVLADFNKAEEQSGRGLL